MKSKFIQIALLTLVVITAFACSNSHNTIERDAQKLAELQCQTLKLLEEAGKGNLGTLEKSTKLSVEVKKLTDELDKKYTSPEDKKNLSMATLKAMGNCK